MSDLWLIIWVIVVAAAFAVAWRRGYLVQVRDYVQATREELHKCTWPTWEELKGSTVLISVCIAIFGLFTFLVDQAFFQVVRLIAKIGAS